MIAPIDTTITSAVCTALNDYTIRLYRYDTEGTTGDVSTWIISSESVVVSCTMHDAVAKLRKVEMIVDVYQNAVANV